MCLCGKNVKNKTLYQLNLRKYQLLKNDNPNKICLVETRNPKNETLTKY